MIVVNLIFEFEILTYDLILTVFIWIYSFITSAGKCLGGGLGSG
jgi:hypothetical protein